MPLAGRCRRRRVVTDISPDPPRHGLLPGQHRHRVSSPCSRSAPSTWARMRSCRGASVAQALPTQSASVRDVECDALGREGPLCRVSGRCMANLSQTIIASRPGPARPRGMAWCGRRRLGDGLAGPAAELLPHRLHHLPLPGHHLQRLRDVFPQLDQIAATTAGAGLGRGQHDPLARQVGRQRRPLGLAAG